MESVHKENGMRNIIRIIKRFFNDISYQWHNNCIMSEALEYDIEPHIVDSWLEANYKNHYERG